MSEDAPVQLPAHSFTWEKYGGRADVAPSQVFNWIEGTLAPGIKLLGYCNAKDLAVRPRTTGFALMMEWKGNDFWFHADSLPK